MQIKISTRHGALSDATQSKITAKVEKLTRYFDRLTSIEVTLDLEHKESPTIDLKASAEHKHDFVTTVQAGDLMAGLDQAIQKVEQQLRKYKEKLHDRHRTSGTRSQEPADVVRGAE